MTLEIYPSQVLSSKAKTVTSKKLAKQLKRKLEHAVIHLCWSEPLGLAAPQIGEEYRACFVRDIYMVNPIITTQSKGTHVSGEGCFSKQGFFTNITRHDTVEVRWQDENMYMHKQTFTGRMADIVQHEFDHLQGITIMDRSKYVVTDGV